MKKLLLVLFVVGVLLAAQAARRQGRDALATEAPDETASVTRGSLTLGVSTTGRVVANREVEIKCKASGQVISLPHDVSDPVTEGELLVELDPVDEQRNVRRAEVQLEQSKARVEKARLDLELAKRALKTDRAKAGASLDAARANSRDLQSRAERKRELERKQFVSQEELEQAEAAGARASAELRSAEILLDELETREAQLELQALDIRIAEGTVAADELALETARQRLRETKVLAPLDGVVSDRLVQEGQIISSGINNVGGGTAVLVLSDLSRLFVRASVDESDIARVAVGQRAVLTADALPEARMRGRVVRVATKGKNVSNVVTFEVVIEVDAEDGPLLKPEMTANVEILVDSREDALLVPYDAVRRSRKDRFVTVLSGARRQERTVKLGIGDGRTYEVLEGLRDGEQVLLQRSAEEQSRWSQGAGRESRRGQRMMMRIGGGR